MFSHASQHHFNSLAGIAAAFPIMRQDTTSRPNAISRQREARDRYEFFASILQFWVRVREAVSTLIMMTTAGNHLLDPLIQTPIIRKEFCRNMLKQLVIVIPFSYLAAQVGEAVQNFLIATLRSDWTPEFATNEDNMLDQATVRSWHASFHQVDSQIGIQFRWATSSFEEAEADLIIADAGINQLAIGNGQASDTEFDSDDSGDT